MSKPNADGLVAQAARFAVVGLANTGIGVAAILGLQTLTPAGPFLANAGGYAIGLAVSFIGNRGWTFGAGDGAAGPQAARFVAAFAVAYGLNLAALAAGLALGLHPLLAQLPAIAVYSVVFFLLSRGWVFREAGSRRTR